MVMVIDRRSSSFRLFAEQGYSYAQNNLGRCYENGDGVIKDMKEAVRLYTLASDQGCYISQCNLGLCYERGNGVNQDMKEAYIVLLLNRILNAQNNRCYEINGVNKDMKKAVIL